MANGNVSIGQAKRKRISLFDENAWFANGVEEIKTLFISDFPSHSPALNIFKRSTERFS